MDGIQPHHIIKIVLNQLKVVLLENRKYVEPVMVRGGFLKQKVLHHMVRQNGVVGVKKRCHQTIIMLHVQVVTGQVNGKIV